jgi:16S rRNA (guanine(966)-N(2))-methyltransferase RsmD
MVREALFNSIGESIRGARVADLFAGSGALGMEALSRGASRVSFVDSARACANIVTENLAATGFAQQGDVVLADAIDWLKARRGDLSDFNLFLLDPPYRSTNLLLETLELLDQSPLRPQALVVAEHYRSEPVPQLKHLKEIRQRDYGSTRLTFLRYQ